jgi:hypothetical protein
VCIREVRPLEDCFDGSAVLCYCFDAPWTREDILALGALGRLDYFPEFPRPYFRLQTGLGLQAQGVQGECTCRVVLPRLGREQARCAFEESFTC